MTGCGAALRTRAPGSPGVHAGHRAGIVTSSVPRVLCGSRDAFKQRVVTAVTDVWEKRGGDTEENE